MQTLVFISSTLSAASMLSYYRANAITNTPLWILTGLGYAMSREEAAIGIYERAVTNSQSPYQSRRLSCALMRSSSSLALTTVVRPSCDVTATLARTTVSVGERRLSASIRTWTFL